nr:hypothetical protein [Tanacetum cinerariifolium]
MQVGTMPQAKKGLIFVGQHYGLSDLSGFQNAQGFPQGGPTMFPTPTSNSFFEGAQATPSYDQPMSSWYPSSHPETPNIMTHRPQQVKRANYDECMTFLYKPQPDFLECHIKGYRAMELFWRDLVLDLYTDGYYKVDDADKAGWLYDDQIQKSSKLKLPEIMRERPNDVRLTILMALQKAHDEESCLEEQMLNLMHRFANRFTRRMPEIIRLKSLPDNLLIDYGRYALEGMTDADMRIVVKLRMAKDELLESMEEKK